MAYIDHVTLNGSRQELVSKPATDSIAETYTSKTYAVGDRVMYEGRLYVCTTAITTAESWTPAHWTAKNLVSDITDLKEDLNGLYTAGEIVGTNVAHFSDFEFINAGINSGVLNPNQKFRVSSKNKIRIPFDISITPSEDYKFGIHTYSDDGSVIYISPWIMSEYLVPANTIFRILIAKRTEDTSEIADIPTFLSNIAIVSSLSKTIENKINSIIPGITHMAKVALLNCFSNVDWSNTEGSKYYFDVAMALADAKTLDNSKLENYSFWKNTYPYYYQNEPRRVIYKDLDVPVLGGGLYRTQVRTNKQNIQMYTHVYNKNLIDNYAVQADISESDHLNLTGTWTDELTQIIAIPKIMNGSSAAGVLFGFKHTDNSNIDIDEIESICIAKAIYGELPSGYTAYDYISVKEAGSDVTTDETGYIKTDVYDDLSRVSIAMDYLATSDLGSGNLPMIGVRGENNWVSVVCIYITGGASYTIYSRGNKTFSDVVVKDRVTHIELRQSKKDITRFIENGIYHNFAWTNTNTINRALYLFSNPTVTDTTITQSIRLSSNIQLGQFAIWTDDREPDIYVPVVRNKDNVIGIYNLTKQKFYTCSDVTKATINSNDCLYSVGYWE